MQTYHKINTLFKRDMTNKGQMINGAWSTPELEYLANNEWEFTEKVDGTNIRVGWEACTHPQFSGRTDAAVIPKHLLEYLHATFTAGLFESEGFPDMEDSVPIILHGEGYGPKIQGGGKYRDDHAFVLFDVQVGGWWLKREDVDDVAKKLGIDSVPIVGYGTLYDAIRLVGGGSDIVVTETQELDVWRPPMRSAWGNFEAEGIVARPRVAMFDRRGDRIICKIKAVDFK